MKLLILFGPPSVGKLTVGKLLEEQTDFKLFHNHAVMDGIMHIFDRGTPAEDRLSRLVRENVIREAAEGELDLIFTYTWDFSRDKGKHNIDAYKQLYESRGGEVYFVELVAPANIRAIRASNPERYRNKVHAPRAEEVADPERAKKFVSPTPFFYPKKYLQIGTSDKQPSVIATDVIAWLDPA
jgi:hypothetical protein